MHDTDLLTFRTAEELRAHYASVAARIKAAAVPDTEPPPKPKTGTDIPKVELPPTRKEPAEFIPRRLSIKHGVDKMRRVQLSKHVDMAYYRLSLFEGPELTREEQAWRDHYSQVLYNLAYIDPVTRTTASQIVALVERKYGEQPGFIASRSRSLVQTSLRHEALLHIAIAATRTSWGAYARSCAVCGVTYGGWRQALHSVTLRIAAHEPTRRASGLTLDQLRQYLTLLRSTPFAAWVSETAELLDMGWGITHVPSRSGPMA